MIQYGTDQHALASDAAAAPEDEAVLRLFDELRLDVVRQIRVLLRDLEEDGEVARAEAVPGVEEMGEERERRRLLQGQSVTQIWPEDNIEELKWKEDSKLWTEMTAENEAELKTLEDKIKDAEENLGESEHREALLAKAEFLTKIGMNIHFDCILK